MSLSLNDFNLLLEEHCQKLEQLKSIINFYEEKQCVFSSFQSLNINNNNKSVFSDRRRCGKILRSTAARRITPQNVTTL